MGSIVRDGGKVVAIEVDLPADGAISRMADLQKPGSSKDGLKVRIGVTDFNESEAASFARSLNGDSFEKKFSNYKISRASMESELELLMREKHVTGSVTHVELVPRGDHDLSKVRTANAHQLAAEKMVAQMSIFYGPGTKDGPTSICLATFDAGVQTTLKIGLKGLSQPEMRALDAYLDKHPDEALSLLKKAQDITADGKITGPERALLNNDLEQILTKAGVSVDVVPEDMTIAKNNLKDTHSVAAQPYTTAQTFKPGG